ncbi:hypothetical protein DBR32_10905 [Taibaiella sp. KBW10]|uniref:lipopolysaccharide biosynthesis protein n=1 Tax=Taibaiella sp. KBW10 TaxID=2153357 RepID=UPI000F5A543D|nr:hypothetical protein [Taibaiella sp. KBW10]RQO30088.1 hypothetical protein DBR32_10905 [Taibaiella sp. KBW10]
MQDKTLNKIIYKDSFLIFSIRLLSTLAMILISYYFSHQLSTADYGRYTNYWNRFYAFNAFAGLGIAAFIFTYSKERLTGLLRKVKRRHYFILSGLMLSGSLAFALVQHHYAHSFTISLAFILLNTLCIIAESALIIFRKFKQILFINIGYLIVYLYLHFEQLSGAPFNAEQLFRSLCVLFAVKLLISLAFLRKDKQVPVDAEIEKEEANYQRLWLHLYIFDMTQILMVYVDKFVVSILLDESTSAIYSNGSTPIPLLPIIFSAVSSASLMQFSRNKKNDVGVQLSIMNNLARTLSNFAFPIFFFFLFFHYEFITSYFSNKYIPSIPIFVASLFVIPLRMLNYTIIFQKYERGDIINTGVVLDVVATLLLVYPLYRLMGLPGIALSFVLGTYIQAGYYLYKMTVLLQRPLSAILPLKNLCLKFLLYGLLAFGLHEGLSPFATPYISMLSTILIFGLVIALVIRKEYKSSTIA